MKQKLDYLSERQGVLAQNIANADTPNYQAMDIAEPDFAKMVSGAAQKLPMAVTDPKHLSSAGTAGAFIAAKRKTTAELNPNGNNVAIEEEMSKTAQNQAEYQKVLNLYGKMITMFKTAIGNPSTGS